ncbi:DUF1883 domain-containing protein [Streptosporangium sp. NPDC051022]|uniref:DUF1883 domain-containing protein n=1 Tax=Streptosporangium sp. NPDC051022 TaxID=3155752 RepID=UPI003415A813
MYWELGSRAGGACFEVELRGSAARVCLMDSDDYQAYLDGGEYEYYGGFYNVSPVVLQVPYDDYWYLVVDSNGHRVRGGVTEVFD